MDDYQRGRRDMAEEAGEYADDEVCTHCTDVGEGIRALADADPAFVTVEKEAGAGRIAAERERQVAEEGWTAEHDSDHLDWHMLGAAACYALHGTMPDDTFDRDVLDRFWRWELRWWKPKNRLRNLERAGALIAAEIDRMQRLGADDAR